MRIWLILAVVFYPLFFLDYLLATVVGRSDRLSALVSGLIVFLVLWLYALPRDLAWRFGSVVWESRLVLPASAYLIGLAVAGLLMWFAETTHKARR